MKCSRNILTILAVAAFLFANPSGSSYAEDVPVKQVGKVNARAEKEQKGALDGGKKVSLKDPAVEAPAFPLLDKIMRDVNAKLQKQIESKFARQLEEKLSRQISK